MGQEENPKQGAPEDDPTPSQGNKATEVDVELTDEELDKVSGGFNKFPVQPATTHIPFPGQT